MSIVIPAFHSTGTLRDCLESLAGQSFKNFEVVLIDSTPGDESALQGAAQYSFVRAIHWPHRLLPHQARNEGAIRARAAILVFSDPDMRFEPHWLSRLVEAREQGHAVAGGGVLCPGGYWTWAVHIVKYGLWLAGGRAGARQHLASGNLAIDRALFERASGFPDGRWAGDTALSYSLRALGETLWFEPNATCYHLDVPSVGSFLRERFQRGHDFGFARAEWRKWTRLGFAVHLLALPITILVVTARTNAAAFRAGFGLRALVTLPVQLPGYASWCIGEATAFARLLVRKT